MRETGGERKEKGQEGRKEEMLWGKKIHKFENAETIQSETVGGKEKWEGRKEGGERERSRQRAAAGSDCGGNRGP